MNKQQEQLIQLLISNSQPAWQIETIFKRCCLYFGMETALEECQKVIDFANQANISLLESFRLQVEISEMLIDRAKN